MKATDSDLSRRRDAVPGVVVRAAQWLAEQHTWETGLRRQLQERFGLDGFQIAEAVEQARKMELCRRVFG